MIDFYQYLQEQPKSKKPIVFSFGRFSPPTTGHEKLVNKIIEIGKGKPVWLFTSQTFDSKKNPLTYGQKTKYMKVAFPKVKVITDRKIRTPFQAIEGMIDKGFDDITFVAGSDRVKEFQTRFNKQYPNINIKVVSAGERDADAEDVSGMSASKMRLFAVNNEFQKFKAGLPVKLRKHAREVFDTIRKGMQISEEIVEEEEEMYSFSQYHNNIQEASIKDIAKKMTDGIKSIANVNQAILLLSTILVNHTDKFDTVVKLVQREDFKAAVRILKSIATGITEETTVVKQEVAPPGKKAERFIKNNKAAFKKRYGSTWEKALYATAWKVFGKKVAEQNVRDYKREYEIYHSKREQIKRRAGRVTARRKMEKEGRAKKGDGMDVHHKNHNTTDNRQSNLAVMDASRNRSIK